MNAVDQQDSIENYFRVIEIIDQLFETILGDETLLFKELAIERLCELIVEDFSKNPLPFKVLFEKQEFINELFRLFINQPIDSFVSVYVITILSKMASEFEHILTKILASSQAKEALLQSIKHQTHSIIPAIVLLANLILHSTEFTLQVFHDTELMNVINKLIIQEDSVALDSSLFFIGNLISQSADISKEIYYKEKSLVSTIKRLIINQSKSRGEAIYILGFFVYYSTEIATELFEDSQLIEEIWKISENVSNDEENDVFIEPSLLSSSLSSSFSKSERGQALCFLKNLSFGGSLNLIEQFYLLYPKILLNFIENIKKFPGTELSDESIGCLNAFSKSKKIQKILQENTNFTEILYPLAFEQKQLLPCICLFNITENNNNSNNNNAEIYLKLSKDSELLSYYVLALKGIPTGGKVQGKNFGLEGSLLQSLSNILSSKEVRREIAAEIRSPLLSVLKYALDKQSVKSVQLILGCIWKLKEEDDDETKGSSSQKIQDLFFTDPEWISLQGRIDMLLQPYSIHKKIKCKENQ